MLYWMGPPKLRPSSDRHTLMRAQSIQSSGFAAEGSCAVSAAGVAPMTAACAGCATALTAAVCTTLATDAAASSACCCRCLAAACLRAALLRLGLRGVVVLGAAALASRPPCRREFTCGAQSKSHPINPRIHQQAWHNRTPRGSHSREGVLHAR